MVPSYVVPLQRNAYAYGKEGYAVENDDKVNAGSFDSKRLVADTKATILEIIDSLEKIADYDADKRMIYTIRVGFEMSERPEIVQENDAEDESVVIAADIQTSVNLIRVFKHSMELLFRYTRDADIARVAGENIEFANGEYLLPVLKMVYPKTEDARLRKMAGML